MSDPSIDTEHTRWSPGLIGFYLSCAGTALGATIAGGSHFFFESSGGTWFGSVMALVCMVACYFSLRNARRPPGEGGPGGARSSSHRRP